MKNRTKITIVVATLLLGVALLNVGFAAWVFSNNAEKTYEANVFTESVTDRSCVIKDVTDDLLGESQPSIHFGLPAHRDGGDDVWLDSWSDTENENLTYKRAFSVSKNITTITIDFKAYLGDEDHTDLNFGDAVNKGLIAAPECFVADSRDGDKSLYFSCAKADGFNFTLTRERDHDYSEDPHDTTTLYVTFVFGWGSHFNFKNPYDYYNAMRGDDPVSNPYTYTGDAVLGNVTVNTNPDPNDTAEARVDAFASLWELDRLVDGLTYKFRMSGVAE